MRSEFLIPNRCDQYEARSQLRRAGFNATCLDIPYRPILLVEHPRGRLDDVDDVVTRVAPHCVVVSRVPGPREGDAASTDQVP